MRDDRKDPKTEERKRTDELILEKETLKDLAVDEPFKDAVKGGINTCCTAAKSGC